MTLLSPLILVVDDDDDDRLMLGQAFEEKASECRLAFVSDGTKCLEFLLEATQFPALILMDLNMPGMNGIEVLSKLRATPQWKKLPVVILSTSNSQEQINMAYQEGANSYITKPNTFEDLAHMAGILCSYWLNLVKQPTLKNSLVPQIIPPGSRPMKTS
ncbi:MAG: response regulator [Cytophagaceae bacterium]|nr:response regulator [Cytophagaceae bacterium]